MNTKFASFPGSKKKKIRAPGNEATLNNSAYDLLRL